jgi:hypothetical protein
MKFGQRPALWRNKSSESMRQARNSSTLKKKLTYSPKTQDFF